MRPIRLRDLNSFACNGKLLCANYKIRAESWAGGSAARPPAKTYRSGRVRALEDFNFE